MIAPEDLEPGKLYLFDYITDTGRKVSATARFVRMTIGEHAILFYFRYDDGETAFDTPFSYDCLSNLRKV